MGEAHYLTVGLSGPGARPRDRTARRHQAGATSPASRSKAAQKRTL